MEYRESPRIAPAEERINGVIDEAGSRPRFHRFELRRFERRFDMTRFVLALIAALAVVLCLGYLGARAVRGAVRWLHRQPQYQVKFIDIQLRDPPPAWFRGGTEIFLKRVRDNARERDVLPVLDLESGRIERAFKVFPWVDDVLRVEYPPHSIKVHLAYKTPVAMIPFPRGQQIILDQRGHLLPLEDVDTELLGPLVKITGDDLALPPETNHALAWKSSTINQDRVRIDHCVLDAARMAGFLTDPDRTRQSRAIPGLRFLEIRATDPRGLFLYNAEGTWILWGEAPSEEPVGRQAALEKWEILRKWAEKSPRPTIPPRDYWVFSRLELKHVRPGNSR
jgi:hypothetical protein